MYTALYYPHTTVGDSDVLRSALLLWDQLEFIVPRDEVKLEARDNDPIVEEALELIGKPRLATGDEQQEAHRLIEDLATSELPTDFLLDEAPEDEPYLIYPQKFLPETWQILRDAQLAVPESESDYEDWVLRKNLGLSMMSILAEACAGSQKRTVTDKTHAYELLAQSIAQIHGGILGEASTDMDRLVTVTVNVVDPSQFSLQDLIALRKRELNENGTTLRDLRHNYLETIDSMAERLTSCSSDSDIAEVYRVFEQKMAGDFDNLREALQLRRNNAILSKEVGVGILAVAGMAVTPWTFPSGLLAIGALVKQAKNYRADRRKIMKNHAMAWLLELSQQQRAVKLL